MRKVPKLLVGGDALEGATPGEPDLGRALSDLAAAAAKGMNSTVGNIGSTKVEVVNSSSHSVPTTRDPMDHFIRPEGEGRVDRTTPKKDPEFHYTSAEVKLPQSWGTAVPYDDARNNGYELVPGEDPTTQIRVRMRIPYSVYLARIAEGERKSNEMRRAKRNTNASLDKTERAAINLTELFAGDRPDVEAAAQIGSERMTNQQ